MTKQNSSKIAGLGKAEGLVKPSSGATKPKAKSTGKAHKASKLAAVAETGSPAGDQAKGTAYVGGAAPMRSVYMGELTAVEELARQMDVPIRTLISRLFVMGYMVTGHTNLDRGTAKELAAHFGFQALSLAHPGADSPARLGGGVQPLPASAVGKTQPFMGEVMENLQSLRAEVRQLQEANRALTLEHRNAQDLRVETLTTLKEHIQHFEALVQQSGMGAAPTPPRTPPSEDEDGFITIPENVLDFEELANVLATAVVLRQPLNIGIRVSHDASTRRELSFFSAGQFGLASTIREVTLKCFLSEKDTSDQGPYVEGMCREHMAQRPLTAEEISTLLRNALETAQMKWASATMS